MVNIQLHSKNVHFGDTYMHSLTDTHSKLGKYAIKYGLAVFELLLELLTNLFSQSPYSAKCL